MGENTIKADAKYIGAHCYTPWAMKRRILWLYQQFGVGSVTLKVHSLGSGLGELKYVPFSLMGVAVLN